MKSRIAKLTIVLAAVAMVAAACAPAATSTPTQPTAAVPTSTSPGAQPTTAVPTTQATSPVATKSSGVVLHAIIRPDEGGNIAQYAALFEQQTGIKVQVDFVGWDTIHNKIVSTLAGGGGGYDIIFIPSANAYEFLSAGWFEPIDDVIPASERDQWLKSVVDLYTYDGHLSAMPWYSGGAHMAYNKDILAKAGVDPAAIKTWDDFMAACKTIKEKGAAEYCFTPSAKYPGEFYYGIGTMLLANGAGLFDQTGAPVFQNGTAGVNAFTLLKEGVDQGYFNKAGIDMEDYATLVEFGTGKTAFLLDSTWSVTNANSNKELSQILGKVGYMLIPGYTDPNYATLMYAGGLGILKTSTHKAEAKEYLQFQTSQAAQKDHAIKGSNMPTRVALFKDPDIAAAWPGFANLAEQLNYGQTEPKVLWLDEWRHSLASSAQDTLAGRKTPEEAVQWLADEARRIAGSK